MSDGGRKKKIKLRIGGASPNGSRAGSPVGAGSVGSGSRAGSPQAQGKRFSYSFGRHQIGFKGLTRPLYL